MKKYVIIFILLLSVSAFSQKKKYPPLKKTVIEEPPKLKSFETEAQGDREYYVVVPENSLTSLRATTINGKEIQVKDFKELADMDFSQWKSISFTTRISGKSIETTILKRIFDEAISLESLEISNFAIESFPEIKAPNKKLKELSLTRNKLKTLPASISNLVALENLQSSNPLTELPESFSQLKNLKQLGLNYTEFSEFPKAIFNLDKLTLLYVSGVYKGSVKIKELPDLFHQLPNLKEFGLTNASLTELPKSFSSLKKLEKIALSSNQFKSFPEVLAANKDLSYVPFDTNPLQFELFLASVKKIKWRGLFFLNETNLSKKQYEEIQKILSKTDVYYDGMND